MTDGASIRELERRLAAAPASPLFARLAAALLAHGEIARAETLCERGVDLYPRYSTGRLVHARCLAARGRYAEALEALEAVEAGYPGNIVLDGLAEEWTALAGNEESVAAADDGAVFTDLPREQPPAVLVADDAVETPAVETPAVETPAVETPVVETAAAETPVGGSLPDETTRRETPISGSAAAMPATVPEPVAAPPAASEPVDAGAPPDHTEVLRADGVDPPAPVPTHSVGTIPILQPVPRPLNRTSFIGPDRIVSRTLAEIYASQGAIGEAVETYRILIENMPERSGQLGGRLRELEERLRTDPGPRPAREE